MHDFVQWTIQRTTLFNKFFAWADDLAGFGKMGDPRKYWDKPFKRS